MRCLVNVSGRGGVSGSSADGVGGGRGRWRRQLTLKDLEVLNVGVLAIHVELDAGHGDVEEDAVVDLAEGSAGRGGDAVSVGSSSCDVVWRTHPVPHCSTFVTLSWRRLLSHCTSSCLQGGCELALCLWWSVSAMLGEWARGRGERLTVILPS